MFDTHLDRETASRLAVINLERAHLRLALGDCDMAGAVVSHEHDVMVVVDCVVFRERTASPEAVHDFHRLDILDLVLPCHWNSAGRKQTGAKNDGTNGIFVVSVTCALVVVGQRAEMVLLDQHVKSRRSPGRAPEFLFRAIVLDVKGGPEFCHSSLGGLFAHFTA